MTQRVALVSGGFGALGRVVSDALKADGFAVVRVDYASAAPTGSDGYLDLADHDLADASTAKAAVESALQAFGRLDVIVNIAGGFTWETLADGSAETWQRMFATNVLPAVNLTSAAIKYLCIRPHARVINIGAAAAIRATKGMGSYAAAKSAVHRLTESLSDELSDQDVTVNAVLPTIIDKLANRASLPGEDYSKWVSPDAIADVICFLASPASRAISGALIRLGRAS